MSDNSWVLKGIDPEARGRAEEEAVRLGVSVADYLTNLVVRRAVLDQLAVASEAEPTHEEPEEAAIFAPPPESSEGFAVRQRLKALERRLGTAVGSLDGALHALDTSLFDITARVGDVEALAGDTAHALGQTQTETNNAFAGLQIHLAVVEDNLSGQAEAQEARAAGLDQRIDGVEYVARGAERSAAILADAHEALKHAVAADFADFTHETADRLNANLADLSAAADAAAEHADAAVAHLVNELRGFRASIELRLEENAEQTRGRMHAAFADAAGRMTGLAERVSDNERLIARTADHLRAQITDVEDGAQVALEETAHALRNADAVLAADLARAAQEHYAALQATRSDLAAQMQTTHAALAGELGVVREEQVAHLARLKLVDVAVGNTINSIAELREGVDRRVEDGALGVRAVLEQANAELGQSLDAVAARVMRGEQQTQALQQRLGAELDRIEASTFAALEKLRRDIGAGDADVTERLNSVLNEIRGDLSEVRNRSVNEAHLLRQDQAGALARLTLLDTALTRLEGATITSNTRIEQLESGAGQTDEELVRKLAQLEFAAAHAETEQALAIVRNDAAALTDRLNTLYADTALADRLVVLERSLGAQDSKAEELSEGLQGVARMLNRIAAQGLETVQSTDTRVHQVEVALADLRLQSLSNADANATATALQVLEERVAAFEALQASALETLRLDIARFVGDNDRRLEALETAPSAAPQGNLASEFDALRSSIEERVIGVELRSVRTLEQVVDTVALLEQRLLGNGASEDQAAKIA